VYLRKISDGEHPLRLRLLTGPDEKLLSFVLKENETGEINVSTLSLLWEGRGKKRHKVIPILCTTTEI